jgi:hypothetical protein
MTVLAEQFAQAVEQAIMDFVDFDRVHHLAEARRLAPPAQQPALRALWPPVSPGA